MQTCRVTIASSADGQENESVKKGSLAVNGTGATVCYQDGEAQVQIVVDREQTVITRRGDYEMRLVLRKGEICAGTIGIMGSSGQVYTQTHALAYSVSERSLLLSAQYDLLFDKERQAMKIRLHARL